MNKETDVFFTLLRAGLWGKDVQLAPYGKIDFAAVLDLAEEQSVVGLLAAGIEHVVDGKPQKKDVLQFIGRTVQLEQRNQAMNYFIAALVEKMRKAGIYTLLVKGQGVAQCYERPLWRACGDVDFFLSDDNYERAKAFLTPLASEVESEYKGSKHLGMTIGPWVVELHGSLSMGLPRRINDVLDEIQADTFYGGNVRTWDNDGTQVFMLGKENDAVYVFAHFFNHFYKGGLGLRQICDWCRLLWTYRDTLDVMKVESLIRRMGLVSEWKAFAALAVNDLGMPVEAMPMYDDSAKWSRKAERIKAFVMSVGNMGHNRDMSYYGRYPYVIRKFISMKQRIGDLISHARIFPIDSLRFFPTLLENGLRSAVNGEG
jgi:hypothetical protein